MSSQSDVTAPTRSELESARFGRNVARWHPAHERETIDPSPFDIVIVRRPAAWSRSWYELTSFDGYRAIHADTLMYWEWVDRAEPIELQRPARMLDDPPWVVVEALVRDVFADYGNHYSSNPLLDPRDALDGYVQWAASTVQSVPRAAAVLQLDGVDMAFAITDWDAGPPDVRLAGVASAYQRMGWYPELIRRVMIAARSAEVGRIRISTQADNIAPQRVWASLGWRPIDVLNTVHLVRNELLSARLDRQEDVG